MYKSNNSFNFNSQYPDYEIDTSENLWLCFLTLVSSPGQQCPLIQAVTIYQKLAKEQMWRISCANFKLNSINDKKWLTVQLYIIRYPLSTFILRLDPSGRMSYELSTETMVLKLSTPVIFLYYVNLLPWRQNIFKLFTILINAYSMIMTDQSHSVVYTYDDLVLHISKACLNKVWLLYHW